MAFLSPPWSQELSVFASIPYWGAAPVKNPRPGRFPRSWRPRLSLPPSRPSTSTSGLLDIQLADRDFDTPKFLSGARQAYAQIVTAFASADRPALRSLLSPDVYEAFDAGITARTVPAASFVKLNDARIVSSALRARVAEITVAFTAEFSTGTVTDVWTFERNLDNADPNWTLIATSGDLPE